MSLTPLDSKLLKGIDLVCLTSQNILAYNTGSEIVKALLVTCLFFHSANIYQTITMYLAPRLKKKKHE